MLRIRIVLFLLLVLTIHIKAESEIPTREVIDSTFSKMMHFAVAGDYQSWAGFLAEDATFTNSALPEPVVGRDAILELAGTWSQIENVTKWTFYRRWANGLWLA